MLHTDPNNAGNDAQLHPNENKHAWQTVLPYANAPGQTENILLPKDPNNARAVGWTKRGAASALPKMRALPNDMEEM